MSSGIIYPPPTYIPPLPIFNPLFFPQSFGTTTTSGGGGGQTNIFPNGLSSGNVITLNGGTGGGGGTGVERTITGISYLEFVDSADTNPTNITGYITLNGNTLEIGSANNSTGINVNLQGTTISANGTPIGGGDVFLAGNNIFTGTNDFQSTFIVDNTQTNIGQLPTGNNTGIGLASLGDLTSGNNNSAFGYTALQAITTGSNNTGLGYASLSSSLTDDNNTAVGYWSGFNLNGGGSNTYLGYESGYNQTTGSGNVAIGFQVGVDTTTPTLSNTIAIGKGINSVATGDMILGFTDYTAPGVDYYAKITPNTTDQGVQIQGTYNNSQNFTIDATGQSILLKATNIGLNASNTISISNILQSPNNPTINTTTLASSQGTFYVSSQLPYFAYNNAGTITSQQLATSVVSSSFTLTLTPVLNPITNSTNWTTNTIIPSATLSSNIFTFSYYTNITNTNVIASGIVSPSGNFVAGTGTAILQPVNTSYNTYLFNLINNGGSMTVGSSGQVSPPTITFAISDAGYFYNNSVNLVFSCLKIF